MISESLLAPVLRQVLGWNQGTGLSNGTSSSLQSWCQRQLSPCLCTLDEAKEWGINSEVQDPALPACTWMLSLWAQSLHILSSPHPLFFWEDFEL